MSVQIKNYSDELVSSFNKEKNRIKNKINDDILIHHVGSSAVKIGGKNIIDILIGAKDKNQMRVICNKLTEMGYFEGRDTHSGRIFMASKKEETGDGDYHIHICLVSSDSYQDFLYLKRYLIENKDKAIEYLAKKKYFAKEADYDRKKYKQLKSAYVSRLLSEAKNKLT